MDVRTTQPQILKARLGLWDTTSIIVGIIVGVGIYYTPAMIFGNTAGPWQALGLWVVGGLLSLIGALCFAELASTYPRSGGEYIYLTRAYGSWMGFLFGWAQLAVIRTGGSIAAVAFAGAEFAGSLFFDSDEAAVAAPLAVLAIVVLTAVNVVGVYLGKRTQNCLTLLKVAGLVGILVAGLACYRWAEAPTVTAVCQGQVVRANAREIVLQTAAGETSVKVPPGARTVIDGSDKNVRRQSYRPEDLKQGMIAKVVARGTPEGGETLSVQAKTSTLAALALALVAVLWAYAGWHEAGYIATEVRNCRRNLPLALLLGTAAVTALYLLINLAYLAGLGFEGAANSREVAADVLGLAVGRWGARTMSLLVVLSSLGAINGMIFTSSRIFSEMGTDHRLFAVLGKWDPRLGTPVRSLVAQAVVSVGMVLGVGVLWEGERGFDALVKCTAAVFWLFFLLTGFAVFVLRVKDREAVRPFRVPGYPLTPLLFCLCCAGMVYGSIAAAPQESLLGLGLLVSGVPLYFLSRGLDRGERHRDEPGPVPFHPETVEVG